MINQTFDTGRLILKVLDESYYRQVLQFMQSGKELFDKYERDKPADYYTHEYHRQMLIYEKALIQKKVHLRLYVFLKTDPGKIIGTVSFSNFKRFPTRCCDIGYKVDPAYHHHGYGMEAVEKAIDVVFNEFGVRMLKAYIQPTNTPSMRLVENIGFEQKELIRKFAQIQGVYRDHYLYTLNNPL